MKRRNFLKALPPLSAAPLVVNGFSMQPFANSRLAKIMADCDGIDERVLVLVQLKGGNDGLNTIVPISQYDRYATLRPNIRIKNTGTKKYINLDTTLKFESQVGLHPLMTHMKSMYDDDLVTVIQGVGYEQINQSHFQGTDIWLSGADGVSPGYSSGWMGRALQAIYPDVLGQPTPTMPDPIGIQVGGSSTSTGFHTDTEHQNAINLSGQDAAGFYSLMQTIGGAPLTNIPDSEYGDELSFIMNVEESTDLYAERISQVFNNGSNVRAYPNTNFANQLKTIARMIAGGSKTKIYLCSLSGFDTHSAQVLSNDPTLGDHAVLVKQLSEGMKAFFDDLGALGIEEKVMACSFSEFGRCAAENGSAGTDHGTLAPMFLFGRAAESGVIGSNVNLSNLTSDNQLQGTQYDYRQVFSTLLQDWLGANNYVMEQTLFSGFSKLPILKGSHVVHPDCYIGGSGNTRGTSIREDQMVIAPNPANTFASVLINASRDYDATLTVNSLSGQMIFAKNMRIYTGNNEIMLDAASYPTGQYFVRLQDRTSGSAEVKKLVVSR